MLSVSLARLAAIETALTQGADVSRDVIGLDLSQTHIWHLGVRIEQERHQARFAEIRPISDFSKGRRIRVSMALVSGNDVARCAPPHRYPFAVGGVGGEDGRCDDRGKNPRAAAPGATL